MEEQMQQQQQRRRQQQQQQVPTLLEQVDTLHADMCKFQQILQENEKVFVEQLSSLYLMSGRASKSRHVIERIQYVEKIQQLIDQRASWDSQVLKGIHNYQRKLNNILNGCLRTTTFLNHIERTQWSD